MIYLQHPEYGYIVASVMPKRNIDEYVVIDEEQYNFAMEQLEKEQENNEDED